VPDLTGWFVLIFTALVGSTIGGVAGFGAGVLLLPVAASVLGLRAAVPVLTVTMLVGNLSRLWWSRGEVDGRVALRYLAGAAGQRARRRRLRGREDRVAELGDRRLPDPGAADPPPARALRPAPRSPALPRARRRLRVPLEHRRHDRSHGDAILPRLRPASRRAHRDRGRLRVRLHVTRGVVFARYALPTSDTVTVGLVLGTTMFAGSWAGRKLVDRLSERAFVLAVEALLVLMGLKLLLFPG
jgi:hypothetical protein